MRYLYLNDKTVAAFQASPRFLIRRVSGPEDRWQAIGSIYAINPQLPASRPHLSIFPAADARSVAQIYNKRYRKQHLLNVPNDQRI